MIKRGGTNGRRTGGFFSQKEEQKAVKKKRRRIPVAQARAIAYGVAMWKWNGVRTSSHIPFASLSKMSRNVDTTTFNERHDRH